MIAAFDYVETREDADALIAEFGQAIQLGRQVATGVAWDPATSTQTFNTNGVVLEFDRRQMNGTTILDTDKRVLVAAGPLDGQGIATIAPPDALVIDGVAVPVINVKILKPAGVVVLFDCQVRF
jgi:hypothetical protein